jgi:TonB family protein
VQVILYSLFFVLALLTPPINSPLSTPVPGMDQTGCAEPNREVTVENAKAAEYPDSARRLGLGPVVVLVEVTVDTTGIVQDLAIYKSSGNAAIDSASLRAARGSTFKPKIVNCVATTGNYIFRVDFRPEGGAPPSLAAAPFPAPTFAPPADWRVVSELPPQSANRWVYSAWQKGDAVLTLSGISVSNSLADIRSQTVSGLTSNGAKILRNEMVRACAGTADALLITYTRQERDKQNVFIADMYARSTRGIYQIVLYAPSAQTLDPAVEAAMKSLCSP